LHILSHSPTRQGIFESAARGNARDRRGPLHAREETHHVRTLTRSLGSFVSGLRLAGIPAEALRVVHTGFADCVGTMIAAASRTRRRSCTRRWRPRGRRDPLPGRPRVPAPEAAWINGTAAHALDYDDVALRGHPSTVLVPAILAEGESLKASGAQMATAYVAGYEVWADLQRRDPQQHHEKGWHPTGIFGAIGAAAACASLRGLDADKAATAIALGASQSAGLVSNFGTMAKPFHAGRSAHAGVIAARLAAAGFTASPTRWSIRWASSPPSRPRAMSTAARDAGRTRLGDPHPGPQREEVSAVLLHAPGHRRRARHAARDQGRRRQRAGDHGVDQPAQRDDPAQQPAADGAGGQVQHAVCDGELDRGEPRGSAGADRRVRAAAGRAGADPEGHSGAG
jgi:hypothetical protein